MFRLSKSEICYVVYDVFRVAPLVRERLWRSEPTTVRRGERSLSLRREAEAYGIPLSNFISEKLFNSSVLIKVVLKNKSGKIPAFIFENEYFLLIHFSMLPPRGRGERRFAGAVPRARYPRQLCRKPPKVSLTEWAD